MKKKYFGTDGIRGRVGESHINPELLLQLGWAAGKVLVNNNHPTVLIGRDTRISGYVLQSALQAGLAAAGVNVKSLGVIPTPGVAYLTKSLRVAAGIVISASHNKYQDNGIKFFDHEGMKLSDEVEFAIEAHLEKPMTSVRSEDFGTVVSMYDAPGRYIEFCKSVFPPRLTLSDIKIVVDCANGACFEVAPSVFRELGAEVVAIGCEPDGFNINEGCGATDVTQLQRKVLEVQADIGIALDGDGDRLILVDEKGESVDGDEILCILAKERGGHLGVVGTLMSNLGLEQSLDKNGISFERANVGDRYVMEVLQKKGWTLGGEASGHIVDLNVTTTGDGIVTALQVLHTMQASKVSLHKLKQAMIKRPQILINVPIKQRVNLTDYPSITKAVSDVELEMQGKGRVLLRPSGTEACVRVMVEGNDEQQTRLAAEKIAKIVERELQ